MGFELTTRPDRVVSLSNHYHPEFSRLPYDDIWSNLVYKANQIIKKLDPN